MEGKIRKELGVTLVALVITIVILIILATVTVNIVFGDAGLVRKSQLATRETANSMEYEEEFFTSIEGYINDALEQNTVNSNPSDPDMPDGWDNKKVTAVESSDGKVVPVPIGFTASEAKGENSVDGGFVIYQGTEPVNDSNVITEQEKRNQFVWIPVDEGNLNKMYEVKKATLSQSTFGEAVTVTDVYSNLRDSGNAVGIPGETANRREPDILPDTKNGDANTTNGINLIKSVFQIEGDEATVLKQWAQMLVDEYDAVYRSIEKYEGFYIGRYEITGDTTTPTVQRGKSVLANQTWYALKKACSDIVNTNEAKSIMIYGNMWDETMAWVADKGGKDVSTNSSSWGNYSNYNTENNYVEGDPEYIEGAGTIQQSGYSDYWSANNIYDLAGNCYDFTQEAYNAERRVRRGGNCFTTGKDIPAATRHHRVPSKPSTSDSARAALYIVV